MRLDGELLKLDIDVGETTVRRYMGRRGPPSQTWHTFLKNHLSAMVSVDFLHRADDPFPRALRLPRVGARRRRILHVGVTAHPTAAWTTQQLREAFPWEKAPRYLLRDQDCIFGRDFVKQVAALGISDVLSTPGAPWQRPYIERVIGTIRRECLDHVIVVNGRSLRRHLSSFLAYYHQSRTHLGWQKDTPIPSPVQAPEIGEIVASPEVGELHHRYERRAA